MVIMDVTLDNFYAFNNFHVNFSYPKKIVGSYIENEHLKDRSNFRYKKVNIIMGANATGKTTFGEMLMKIFNFIDKEDYSYLTNNVCDTNKPAFFSIEMASSNNIFYRVSCRVDAINEKDKYSLNDVHVKVDAVDIGANDSYEACKKKIDSLTSNSETSNIHDELVKVEELYWLYEGPFDNNGYVRLPKNNKQFLQILSNVLKALDSSIDKVEIAKGIEGAYVINMKKRQIVIQDGEKITTKYLSSGTKAGIGVACVLHSIINGQNQFYYCDEKFSYIHNDVERATLGLMIQQLRPNEQLFFTTHNTDLLDMNLPKHSFMFMKKANDGTIEAVNASDFLKRNTDSLRRAVENDIFAVAPSTDLIYEIESFI